MSLQSKKAVHKIAFELMIIQNICEIVQVNSVVAQKIMPSYWLPADIKTISVV